MHPEWTVFGKFSIGEIIKAIVVIPKPEGDGRLLRGGEA
jgi:hypothetical protein